jgi:hypothetical protein
MRRDPISGTGTKAQGANEFTGAVPAMAITDTSATYKGARCHRTPHA